MLLSERLGLHLGEQGGGVHPCQRFGELPVGDQSETTEAGLVSRL